jgi:DNA-binding CsgD family transcriptional regulator
MVVVYLTVSGISPEISIELLQRLFGLTRAEAAVTEKIAAGETLAEAASALMISQQTARTQLKAVFRKTNTRRQAELVKLVLSTPTWMGPGDTREGL